MKYHWEDLIKIDRGLYAYKGYMIQSDKSIWENKYDSRCTSGTGNWYIYENISYYYNQNEVYPLPTLEVRKTLKDSQRVVDYIYESA